MDDRLFAEPKNREAPKEILKEREEPVSKAQRSECCQEPVIHTAVGVRCLRCGEILD